jgi:hypothetical protein
MGCFLRHDRAGNRRQRRGDPVVTASPRRRAKLKAAPSSEIEIRRAVKPKPGEIGKLPKVLNLDDMYAAEASMPTHDEWQEWHRQLWVVTQNPLYAWEAFDDAAKARKQPPGWAHDVVARASAGLWTLLHRRDKAKVSSNDIVKALDLMPEAGRSYVTRYRQDMATLVAGRPKNAHDRIGFKRAARGRWLMDAMEAESIGLDMVGVPGPPRGRPKGSRTRVKAKARKPKSRKTRR